LVIGKELVQELNEILASEDEEEIKETKKEQEI